MDFNSTDVSQKLKDWASACHENMPTKKQRDFHSNHRPIVKTIAVPLHDEISSIKVSVGLRVIDIKGNSKDCAVQFLSVKPAGINNMFNETTPSKFHRVAEF